MPGAINWQNQISQKLIRERYNVINIIDGIPQECGLTKTAYLKSFVCWKTAKVVGGLALTFLTPSLLGKFAPKFINTLGWTPYNGNFVTYSIDKWGTLLYNAPSTAITGVEVIDGIVVTIVVAYASKKLFEKLNETTGPKGFRAWKIAKLDIFIQNKEETIPEVYENDAILHQNICPISMNPIRVPCRSIYNHIFEEAAIKAWLATQIANNQPTTCPLTRQPLNFQNLQIDGPLSDTIELRLLLLKCN